MSRQTTLNKYKKIELWGIPKIMTGETIDTVLRDSSFNALPDRGISQAIAELCEIRSTVNQATGEIEVEYFPYYKEGKLSGFKKKILATKQFYSVGDIKKVELFGQHQIKPNGQFLIIVEGEEDRAATIEMLQKRNKSYNVVGLPTGANVASINTNYEFVDSFDTVMLCLDNDPPGKEAAQKIADLFQPGKIKIVELPRKDPNDMLLAGLDREFLNCIYNAKEYRPDGIVSVDDIYEQALIPVKMGLPWPWKTLTDCTFGRRRGELYGFGAGSGCGKTEGFKEIIDHVIYHDKLVAGIIFLEENVVKTLQVLAGKHANKRFHVPESGWTQDELKAGITDLKGKLYFYRHQGGKDWKTIKAKIKYMVLGLGIKDIFLDHLTALVAHEENEYKALNAIMEELATLSVSLDCTIYYISHLRKPVGTPHEEGGRVTADQFKGSGAIVYWSNFLFGYERNQQALDFDERNTTTFRVLKDRNTGLATGITFQLYYNHSTGRMEEIIEHDDEFI